MEILFMVEVIFLLLLLILWIGDIKYEASVKKTVFK